MKEFVAKARKWARNGAGEMVGFLITLPILIFMLVMVVSIMRLGTLRQRLEYEAYRGAREVVANPEVSSLEDAQEVAYDLVEMDFNDSEDNNAYEEDSLKVEVVALENEDDPKGKEVEWKKGNYVRVTVSVDAKPLFLLMMDGKDTSVTKSESAVMMIESPIVEGGDEYPWFKYR